MNGDNISSPVINKYLFNYQRWSPGHKWQGRGRATAHQGAGQLCEATKPVHGQTACRCPANYVAAALAVASWKNPQKLGEWTSDRQLRMCVGAKSPNRIVMPFCTGVDIRHVVTPANFGSHRFRRFRMARGLVEFQVFPLTFNVVLITLWHYRASVWSSTVLEI